MEIHTMVMQRNNIVNTALVCNIIYRFNMIPMKNSKGLWVEMGMFIFSCIVFFF